MKKSRSIQKSKNCCSALNLRHRHDSAGSDLRRYREHTLRCLGSTDTKAFGVDFWEQCLDHTSKIICGIVAFSNAEGHTGHGRRNLLRPRSLCIPITALQMEPSRSICYAFRSVRSWRMTSPGLGMVFSLPSCSRSDTVVVVKLQRTAPTEYAKPYCEGWAKAVESNQNGEKYVMGMHD
ncbi:hypothetical protein ARMGADRAFT_672463 [Armillaria gallica]|uniref:Uncharacterized protein n=1 Tax=Armillaria gallica TaxID=47427 RepID=A0A2H3CKB0_ARMGA|nr:hypothetical protein ARMGADRAFT_672463 [Armillaria gallica]